MGVEWGSGFQATYFTERPLLSDYQKQRLRDVIEYQARIIAIARVCFEPFPDQAYQLGKAWPG
jgi:hypothetical protein